jgi:hypothetical protein
MLAKRRSMKLENLKTASEANFRRTTGVKRETFNKMVEVLKEALLFR